MTPLLPRRRAPLTIVLTACLIGQSLTALAQAPGGTPTKPPAPPARSTAPAKAAVAPAPRTDGQWELTLQTQYNGRTLSSAMTQCVTKEQAQEPMNTLPGGPDAQQGCRMSNYKVDGSMVTWTIACDGPPPATTQGEYVYQSDSYVGVMRMMRSGQTITTRVNGKRVGDCVGPVASGSRR